jgi:hypothetical protein
MTPIIGLFAVAALGFFWVLSRVWRLVRGELAWDWRIAMLAWHAFWLGAVLGAFACFLLVAHWRTTIFGG